VEGLLWLLLFILIPVVPLTLGWCREIQRRTRMRWIQTLWIPLALGTLSFLWLLTALWLGADFSTHRIEEVWLNVLAGAINGGLSARAANPNKHMVIVAAGCVAMDWFCVFVFQSSV
jgi:hypothetical protein